MVATPHWPLAKSGKGNGLIRRERRFKSYRANYACLAQLAEAPASNTGKCGFDSHAGHSSE